MSLHNITKDGWIEWHCMRHTCSHHNCANWHPLLQCPHHDLEQETVVQNPDGSGWMKTRQKPLGERTQGVPNRIHFTDPGIIWTDEHMINLPPCEECGGRLGMIVNYSEEQWARANHTIVETDNTGNVTNVYPHPVHALNRKLGSMLESINSRYTSDQEGAIRPSSQ